MPDIPRSPYLFQLWGYVQAAVNDTELAGLGAKTQYIWNAYQQRIEPDLPPGTAGPTIFQVGQLVSLAYQQRNARAQLQSALILQRQQGFDIALEPRMYASDLDTPALAGYTRPLQARIRFGATFDVGGIPIDEIHTYEPGLLGPQTVSDVRRMAQEAAQLYAEKYGRELVGLNDFFDLTYV